MKKRLAALSVLGAVLLGCIFVFARGWTKLDVSKITDANVASVIFDKDGNEFMRLGGIGGRIPLTAKEIPERVKNAFVASEDARFFEHRGLDVKRIAGAAISNLRHASLREGGSTITQQLIKLTHLSSEKTFARKINEAYLALKLESVMTKDEILTHYLNTVYFGRGAYGVESAARRFFGKSAHKITLSETALLAGIIKAPGVYSPDANMEKALDRRDYVLSKMLEEGYITKEECESALAEKIELTDRKSEAEFGWYRDFVIEEAKKILNVSADELYTGGYGLYTHLDPERQKRIETIFENEKNFPGNAADGTKAEAAFIAIDPENGGVFAIMGGREYTVQRGLNRASDARRQPGSAVKPISVYAAAVDHLGLSPTDMIDDTKRVFDGGYAPKNAGDSYNGLVTLREALSRSLNVASVSLMEFTGVETAKRYLERAGIPLTDADNGLSIALGSITNGITPLELSQAYAPLANGGMKTEAHAIREITDRNGNVVYSYKPPVTKVMKAQSAYLITSMLETAAQSGSARALSRLNMPIAAKTGTVSIDENKNRDIWTAAYTKNVVCVCWMGFDETTNAHFLRATDTGSSYPAKLLSLFFEKESADEFEAPEGIVRVRIDKNLINTENRAMLAPDIAPEELTVREVYDSARVPNAYSPAFSVPEVAEDARIYERGGKVIAEIEIENENYEYLLIKDTGDKKEVIRVISGQKGEIKETELEQQRNDFLLTVVIRNKLMHEFGVSVTSKESNGVWVSGKNDLMSRIQRLFIME